MSRATIAISRPNSPVNSGSRAAFQTVRSYLAPHAGQVI